MAVLAIGLASAAATSAAGYAGYSALAYSVATTIASTYFKKGESTEGPRLSDLNVTISSYGSVIPRMFGTIRSSANMIWSSGIKETKHKKKVGGKGGFGKATQTTYTYSTSIAYLLCDNEIEAVRRIWSNGEVVYDLSETNSGVSSSLSVNSVKVYKGTETQLPDPTIEANEGVGNVEAYRGCAYIVFDTLQLADFNNALPNFTFEVVGLGGEKTYITQQFGEISEQFNASYYDEENQKLIRIREGNEYDITYYITDLYSNETIIKNFPVIAGYSSPNVRRMNKVNDNILVSSFANYIVSLDSNLNYIGKVDLNTFFNYSSTLSYVQSIALNDYNLKAYGLGFRNNTLSIAEITTATINAETSNVFYYVDASQYAFQESNLSFSATKQLSNKNNGIIIYDNAIYFNYLKGSNTQIFKIDLNFKTLSLVKEIENFSTLNTYGDVFTIDEVSGKLILSGIDNTLTYTYKGSLLTLDLDGLMMSKISVIDAIFKETGNMPDFSLNNAFSISNNRDVLFHASNISVSIFYTISFNIDNLNSYVVNVNDISANMGSGLFFGNFYSYYNSSQQSFLNANNNIRKIDKIITDRHKKSTVFLDQIINTLCLKSGLELSEFDTSDLNDIVVNGYSITNSSTLRSVIEQLIAPFNFNVVESDFKLFFKKNQKPITKVIDIKELGAKNYTGSLSFLDDLTTVRTLEQDLSKSVNITYIDIDDDYNQNTQQSSRENVRTNAVNTVEIALVLSANEAKNIAQRLLYDSYVQRDMFSFDLNYNHIDLESGDVIQVVDNGKKYTMKIRQIQSDGGIIKVEAISYNSYVYDQYAVGSSSASQRNKINVTSRSVPVLLDIPLLTNDDFIGIYSGSYPATEDLKWNGSVMYTSNDNAEFSEKNSYFEKVINGYSINALGNFTEGNTFDSYNYVDVLVNDELENATQNQVLNGANLAILGNEIIQFMNASLIGDKKYRLSGLLRARYATEKYLATHTNSERFIMLDKDTIQAITQSNSLINSNLFYKNVTFGRTLNETASTNFVNTARNQVIPSVRHIQSARNANGDLNVNYIPRLRGIALLLPYAVPDDLDDSNYQIDILKSGAVVRTISTKETFINYTKEMQVADFGAIQSSISMNIYKMNAVIGKGEVRSVTL